MDDYTQKFIMVLKHRPKNKATLREEAEEFIAEYCGLQRQYVTTSELYRVAKTLFVEYLSTANNPANEVRHFFEAEARIGNNLDAILECLRATQVRNANGYINGFKEMED